jgi:Holliday junction resolvasome RuvABC ATP-dependent DNA helicase subunit
MQMYKVFHGPDDPWGEMCPTPEERRALVEKAFETFIGNEKALRKPKAAVYDALGRDNHLFRELALALFGPPSAGKTKLARMIGKALDLPFAEISPKAVRTLDDLRKAMGAACEAEGVPLMEQKKKQYKCPPMIVFIDEVHALSNAVVQGLLKATEYNDAVMVTESGTTVNCYHVGWIIATTDEGRLFDAFRTRFTAVNLKYLSKGEIAKIVKLANPDFCDEVCGLVAHYNSRVPRKALEFARYMRLVAAMDVEKGWAEVARDVATDEGIDEFGMHETHLRILKALGAGPVAKNRITFVAGSKTEEVERFVMPWLLTETEDQPAFVTVTNKGYTITPAGLGELDRRGIVHKGDAALV